MPRAGRVLIGRGRDALDVAMITTFGAARLTGNLVVEVHADQVEAEIRFEAWAVAERCAGGPVGRAGRRPRPDLAVAPDRARPGPGGLELAERAADWTSRAFTYGHGTTTVATTAAEALAGARGVCQDYAHVLLALLRTAGLAARYVSGHLLGEGGTHAWVEVLVPDPAPPGLLAAVGLDPTNARRAGHGYLTVTALSVCALRRGRTRCPRGPA